MAALVKAIEQKRFKQAKILLQLGDDVNQQEQVSGKTPLLAVCFIEDENLACRITKKLLHRGADVCLQDAQGMSPLMQACKLGKEKLAKLLIQSDECDFGAVDVTGNTALIYSVDAGNSRITKALTEAMNIYDVRAADKPNKKGETPLIRAMKLKQSDCIEVLLSDGKASPNARDFDLKLNAREWDLYLKEKEEKENKDKAKSEDAKGEIRKANFAKDGLLNRQQSKNHFERSRTSSIIHYRKDLNNMADAERNSVTLTPDSKEIKPNENFLRRRTKSASLAKNDKPKFLSRSVTFSFEPRNAVNSGFPQKKKVCFANRTLNADESSEENGSAMATTAAPCDKQQTSIKLEEGDWLDTKEALPSPAIEQQKMSSQIKTCENNGGKSPCSQSQLPKLFTLMTQQSTHSFRSSAKKRTSGDPHDKGKSRGGKESTKRRIPRRNSITLQRQFFSSNAARRWSTAETSLIALGRFSSIYSRADFKALNPDNLAMFEKPAIKTRRSSVQSTPEELFTNSKTAKRSETKTVTVSPNLVKLNPDLSASLPGRSTPSRIKSARPRRFARHNSDSFLSASGNLLSGLPRALTSTPVIEEDEEE